MCGIFGILATRPVSLADAAVTRLRDTLAHRGPDGAGLWRHDGCILAHRRLAVIDKTDAAAQPMTDGDRFAIVYNGELYNDAEVRAQLSREGVHLSTRSDTETVLAALAKWGPQALDRFRGMYALAFYDARAKTILLARDPLGIKPLYYRLGPTADGPTLIFASEPRPILEHPDVPIRPDWITISAYLSTIRTVMGERTLFESVRTLRPGQVLSFAVEGPELNQRTIRSRPTFAPPPTPLRDVLSNPQSIEALINDSITAHLRSDVPLCCMLSGGLDSAIIATTLRTHASSLDTYCAGARATGDSATGGGSATPMFSPQHTSNTLPSPAPPQDDLHFAQYLSARLGTHHTEARISRELFSSRWPEMVGRLGLPLSTPNEVAINEIARRMRARGHIVALSGEGADELFAGYDLPMLDAARFEGLLPRDADRDAAWFKPGILHGGDFQLASTAWISPADKSAILAPDLWRTCEHDDALRQFYREEFDSLASDESTPPTDSPLQTHLRFQRRINLAGLLARLDTATMLEGIEGRTPFADRIVAACAEHLPMSDKFTWEPTQRRADPPRTHTKRALRQAFAAALPAEIVNRPKASFPLPMQEWVADHAQTLRRSRFARQAFTMPAIETIAAQPEKCWPLAWPMMNIAMWGEQWWGT